MTLLTQPVRVAIRRSDAFPSFVEEEREVVVSSGATLQGLLQTLALHDRYSHAQSWTFTANGQPLALSEQIGDLCSALRATNFRDGVLCLELLYVVEPVAPAARSDRAAGAVPGAPPFPAKPPAVVPPSPPRRRGRTVVEVKKGLKGIEDEELDADYTEDIDEGAAPRKAKRKARYSGANRTERRATVRYYTRMNPDRMFPLLVILSAEEVAEVVKKRVKQAQSETFEVDEGSAVEIEPVLPGCDCSPPRAALTVEPNGDSTTTIWVVPKVLGRVEGARVIVRQGSKVLAEVPLDIKVAKQTLAVACGLLSLAAPYLTMGLKSLKLDYASQKADGFAVYQRAGNWLAEALRPEWIGLGFLGLAVLLYFWMRPRRRDVFWDLNPKPAGP